MKRKYWKWHKFSKSSPLKLTYFFNSALRFKYCYHDKELLCRVFKRFCRALTLTCSFLNSGSILRDHQTIWMKDWSFGNALNDRKCAGIMRQKPQNGYIVLSKERLPRHIVAAIHYPYHQIRSWIPRKYWCSNWLMQVSWSLTLVRGWKKSTPLESCWWVDGWW